jgi:hypothetical protein
VYSISSADVETGGLIPEPKPEAILAREIVRRVANRRIGEKNDDMQRMT